jgi:IS30 family transposase
MTLGERMDIFRLLSVERLKPSAIAAALNRQPSSITRELERGMDKGMYNPVIAEARHREARRNQRPRLKMTDEACRSIKGQLEKRWSPEEVATWLERAYPCYAMWGKTIYNYIFSPERGVEKAGPERIAASREGAEREQSGRGAGENTGNEPYRQPSCGNKHP